MADQISEDTLITLFDSIPKAFVQETVKVYGDANSAMEFLLQNGHDQAALDNLRQTLQPAGDATSADEPIAMMMAMGFSEDQCKQALKATRDNADMAVALLLGDTGGRGGRGVRALFGGDDDDDSESEVRELPKPKKQKPNKSGTSSSSSSSSWSQQPPVQPQPIGFGAPGLSFGGFGGVDGGALGGAAVAVPQTQGKGKKGKKRPHPDTPAATIIPQTFSFGSGPSFGFGGFGFGFGSEDIIPTKRKKPSAPLVSHEELVKIVDAAQHSVHAVLEQLTDNKGAPPDIPDEQLQQLTSLYDEIIDKFNCKHYWDKYGSHRSDGQLVLLGAGDPVPNYYANVVDGSIWRRKVLSLAGLRNLVLYGREIFSELKASLFVSDPNAYGRAAGIHKMRNLTGNTVDLDTVVLRCSDGTVLKTINERNKAHGGKQYGSGDEFGESEEAKEIALNTAKPLLDGFIKDFKLTKAQTKSRKIDLPNNFSKFKMHVASGSGDRGKWAVWQYVNQGVNTFHANVPNMHDVVGALLLAPFAAARAYLLCRNDEKMLEDFFENAISDSCFNQKWKALEEFNLELDSRDTIKRLLNDIQAKHQDVFTNEFFNNDDENNTNEIAEM
eukprot:TRINITY_DN62304_c0_g1_i2.p1 TRINITY_DN62304_c0_g1~~TRINITY_DN62304_c0_g1_i2.p1  ORF type:complete len:611 (-),score=71.75 TRINITY_DN62304_c0_g1_i2:31-1863(-)